MLMIPAYVYKIPNNIIVNDAYLGVAGAPPGVYFGPQTYAEDTRGGFSQFGTTNRFVAIGDDAGNDLVLPANTYGFTAVGYRAMGGSGGGAPTITSAVGAVAVGYEAMAGGVGNFDLTVAIGYAALGSAAVTAYESIAVGNNALAGITHAAHHVTAIGSGVGTINPALDYTYCTIIGAFRGDACVAPGYVEIGSALYKRLVIDDQGKPTFYDNAGVASSVGYLNIPNAGNKSANYTTVLGDAGKRLRHPSTDANARTFTIDSYANVPYPDGTTITFVNRTANVLTIAVAAGTLTLGGTATTGNRSIAVNGVGTALMDGQDDWIISGPGVT